MYKDGKWAKQVIALQEEDGKWGCFHSLSQFYGAPMTTEQALRRLEILGYTIEDECIQKAVAYMEDCLQGKKVIPDRREKVHDWDIFTAMILAVWIRRFTMDSPKANEVAHKWAAVVTAAFRSGRYDHDEYVRAYHDIFGMKPGGGRLIDFVNFYPISLLRDCLDGAAQNAVMEYVLNKEDGIYYIYKGRIHELPAEFESRKASRYLGAIELLVKYSHAKHQLDFVVDWLEQSRNENGRWDMGKAVNDKVYFPLSDSWRKAKMREADCTWRIDRLLEELK